MNWFSRYLICLIIVLFSLPEKGQTIASLPAFSYTNSFIPQGQIQGFAEDTVNNFLHFQNSCNCGAGPGNNWNGLSYGNTSTYKMKTPYIYFGQFGDRFWSKELIHCNNKIVVYDSDTIYAFNASNYASLWNKPISTPNLVDIITQRNDSMFLVVNNAFTCNELTLLNAVNGSTISFNSFSCSGSKGYLMGEVKVAKIVGGKLYLGGKFEVYNGANNLVDSNLVAVKLSNGDPEYLNSACNDTVQDIEIYRGKLYIGGSFTSVKGQVRNRFAALDLNYNLLSGTPAFNSQLTSFEVYDDYLIALGKYTTINGNTVNPSGNYILKSVNLKTNSIMSWNFPFALPQLTSDKHIMKAYRNKLYVSPKFNSPPNIDGFCLPPIKSATTITTFTNSVCEGSSNVIFSVPPYLYGSSYSWMYTGTGATLTPNSNSVSVNFANGATAGKIKVVGSSACGSKGDTISLTISILPKPNAIASLVDDTLNCYHTKVPLLGNSFTPNVSYQWGGPSGYFSPNQNDSTGNYLPGVYVVTVTSNVTGCKNTASVTVRLDTIKPNVILPVGPYIIPCNPNYFSLNGSSSTSPAILQWRNALSTTWYPNPYQATAAGNYILEVQSVQNGCKSNDTLSVSNSTAIPTVTLVSHPSYVSPFLAADSVTCFTPSLQIAVAFSPTNCSVQWKDLNTNQLYSNPITVTTQGNFMPIITRLDNSCTDSSKIVYIKQNVLPPNVFVITPAPSVNCSYATATLNAVVSPTTCTMQWSGPATLPVGNTATTTIPGKYVFTAFNPANGCQRKDSVNVAATNSLIVNAGNDTITCKGNPIVLTAAVMGTVSSLNYQWSTGGNTYSTTVSANNTSDFIVTVMGSGCFGTDTVKVIIPSDIQDSIVSFKGCTGNSGSLVVYAKGGIPPYKFSVNGSGFSSVTTYSNLAFGTYTVDIKDSLGCVKTATAGINQNSNSVQASFIASTKNFKGDTVVFVDITVPKADSISWVFPSVATKIGGDMFAPVVVFADTGLFNVTMKVYYGNCMISAIKAIQILPFDTAYASFVNNNGIKSLSVNPNPNNGQFTVSVEFYKKQNASIQVWDAGAHKQFQQNFSEVTVINLPMNLSYPNGTYLLRVIGEFSSKHFNFVISQ